VCTSSIGTWSCTTSGTAANINSFLLGGVIGTDVGLNGCTPVGSKKAYSLGGPGANYCTCNSNVSTYTYSWSSGSYGTCSTSC
jgi:hypothetical protein